jgi:hypothetical protein
LVCRVDPRLVVVLLGPLEFRFTRLAVHRSHSVLHRSIFLGFRLRWLVARSVRFRC